MEMNGVFREIGRRLMEAFSLKASPLAIYGSETIPEGGVHLSAVSRCLAVAMYRIATEREVKTIYLGADRQEGCCPGGLTQMGFILRPEHIKYFISTGKEGVLGGAAEYLKSSPEVVERTIQAVGEVTPPGRYLVVQACDALPEINPGLRSICCFGTAEQIRNLVALVHFDRTDPFSPVIVPWGSACATLIAYPAGMAACAPRDTAFMGP